MKSFKQYLESVDPERYEDIVSEDSKSTRRWNKLNESQNSGWDSFESNPEATEQYINWVSGENGLNSYHKM